MTKIDLEVIGLSQEELQSRVVEKLVEQMLYTNDGDESDFNSRIQDHVKGAADAKIDEIAARFVVPQVGELIENFVLQETNRWGEKVGEPQTFTEYLVARADAYLREPVDAFGKTKDESRDSYWKGTSTRIVSMIDKHLRYHISVAMEAALKDANASIAGGIDDAIKIALKDVQSRLKVTVVSK